MAGKKNKAKEKGSLENVGSLLTPPASDKKLGLSSKTRMQLDGEEQEELKVYLPGMELVEGEKLEVDPSAYVMLHELSAEWPCLSFDIVRDGGGDERTAFPMSGFLVTGTQADTRLNNQLLLLNYTNLCKTQQKSEEQEDDEGEEEDEEGDESSDDDESSGDIFKKKDPRHYCISIPHDGGVNRIRSTNIKCNGGSLQKVLTATWAETGRVHIWDLYEAFTELATLGSKSPSTFIKRPYKPIYSTSKHRVEGFALAWSPLVPGRLLSGDGDAHIYLTEATSERIESEGGSFRGHKGSVEDLQWSPNESTVFASASVDKTVRIWDVRLPRHQSALAAIVHDCDVNVLTWNRNVNHLLATGADDGKFATWDLRKWAPSTDLTVGQAIKCFDWHQAPITSIEWSPHDPTVLAVAGADDQLTIWDFSIDENVNTTEKFGNLSVPPQLLFIHQGQQEVKELHWHPQLSGVILSTALSGFNIFKTISV